jgi:hypothetical protein
VKEPVSVLYNFEPGQPFELTELTGGASGNTVNRTFQVSYAVSIEERDGATWKTLSIRSTKDALGAYLFRIRKSITVTSSTPKQVAQNTESVGGMSAAKGGAPSPAAPPKGVAVGGIQYTVAPAQTPVPPKPAPSGQVATPKIGGIMLLDPGQPPAPVDQDNFSFDNSGTETFIETTADWERSKTYRVTVVGTLWEHISGQWVVAKDRATNQDIKQTLAHTFSTPIDPQALNKNAIKGQQNK